MRTALLVVCLALSLAACSTMPARTPVLRTTPETPAAGGSHGPRAIFVDSATAMLGQPYRYGGAAPGGFDCSGLVVYAASNAGLHVPRTASEQLHSGSAIPRTALKAGDLVFMHLTRKELHVGIAIDSDRFVHAPATGRRVRIDSLSAPPYARAFLTARRIVEDTAAPPAAVDRRDAIQSASSTSPQPAQRISR